MANSNEVIKQLEVPNLATFYAYGNDSIKVVFTDRTILRMQKNCEAVRILDRMGHEMVFNIRTFQRCEVAMKEYANYVTVAMEFFEWAFTPDEER